MSDEEGIPVDTLNPRDDDEDEDALDEAARAEVAGFIENDDEEGVEHDDDGSFDEDDKLDEEDLDLIAENLREQQEEDRATKSKYRRLKRAAWGSDDEGGNDDLFLDDEVEPTGQEEWTTEKDFFYDDVAAGMSGASQQQQLREIFGPDLNSLFKIVSGRRPDFLPAVGESIAQETPAETADVNEEKLLRETDQPERLQERYRHRPQNISRQYLETEAKWLCRRLAEHAATVPLPLNRLKGYPGDRDGEVSASRNVLREDRAYPMCDLFNERLQRERYDRIFRGEDQEEKPGDFYWPQNAPLSGEIEKCIVEVLQYLMVDHLEVPYITTHKYHLVCPPLTIEAIWFIYEKDLEWWRLQDVRRRLIASTDNLVSRCEDWLMDLLEQADNANVLQDCKAYLESLPQKELPDTSKRQKRRRVGNNDTDLYTKIMTDSNLLAALKPHMPEIHSLSQKWLSSAADDMLDDVDTDPPPNLPGHETADLENWMLEVVSDNFKSMGGSKLREIAITHYSTLLARHPAIRDVIRKWYADNCAVSVVTTLEGEKSIDPSNPLWLPSRLFRRQAHLFLSRPDVTLNESWPAMRELSRLHRAPPNESEQIRLWIEDLAYREMSWGVELSSAESTGLVELVLHPLSAHDTPPWKREDGRWKRGRKAANRPEFGAVSSVDPYEKECIRFQQSDRDDKDLIRTYAERLCAELVGMDAPTCWRVFMLEVVERMLTKELLPILRKETRTLILKKSEEYVLSQIRKQFFRRLNRRPPVNSITSQASQQASFPDIQALVDEDEDLDEIIPAEEVVTFQRTETDTALLYESYVPLHHYPTVVSLLVDKDEGAVHFVMVNRHGVPVDTRVFPNLLKYINNDPARGPPSDHAKKEHAQFETLLFSRQSRPNIVVVGMTHMTSRDLFNYVQSLSKRIRQIRFKFDVYEEPVDIPGDSAAQALSVARKMQDPVAEYAALWSFESDQPNALLALSFHPLQTKVPESRVAETLLNCLCRMVNDVGVVINKVRTSRHLRCLLPFVCGLGPLKAANLASELNQPLMSRRGLLVLDEHPLGEVVFRNCVTFLRVRGGEEFGLGTDDDPDPLDDTRIHPDESQLIALKMCRDAQDDGDGKADDDATFVAETFKRPEALEDLDLEAYAAILLEGGRPRMLPELETIKGEVTEPYEDVRSVYSPLTALEKFYCLTGEDAWTFMPGCVLTVELMRGPQLNCRLVSSPIGVDIDNLPQTKGGLSRGRLQAIQPQEFRAVVATQPHTVRKILDDFTRYREFESRGWLSPLVISDVDACTHNKKRALFEASNGDVSSRQIRHPHFKAYTHVKLLQTLKCSNAIGTYFFRPSSSHENVLFLYLLLHAQPFHYKCIPIYEDPKAKDGSGQSTNMTMLGEHYTALNDISETYIRPFVNYLEELTKHEKYHANMTPEDLEAQLRNQAKTGPTMLWGICPDVSHDKISDGIETFALVVVGRSKSVKDHLYVGHRGYKLWSRRENNFHKLIAWFKKDGFLNREKYVREMREQTKKPVMENADFAF